MAKVVSEAVPNNTDAIWKREAPSDPILKDGVRVEILVRGSAVGS